jgi:hypothetical protein
MGKNEPKNISTRHCEISRRLPSFVLGVEDKWWDLGEPIGTIAEELNTLFLNHGLPFLESLTTRKAIVEKWEQNNKSLGLPPREKVSIAIIYAYLGNKNKASALLKADLEENRTRPYSDFIQEIAAALDLKI